MFSMREVLRGSVKVGEQEPGVVSPVSNPNRDMQLEFRGSSCMTGAVDDVEGA